MTLLCLTGCTTQEKTGFSQVYDSIRGVQGRQLNQGEYAVLSDRVQSIKRATGSELELQKLLATIGVHAFTDKQDKLAPIYVSLLEDNRDILTEDSQEYLDLRDSLQIDNSLTAKQVMDNIIEAIRKKSTEGLKVSEKYRNLAAVTYALKIGLMNELPYYDSMAFMYQATEETDDEMTKAIDGLTDSQRQVLKGTAEGATEVTTKQ